jgi:hypothetical protein
MMKGISVFGIIIVGMEVMVTIKEDADNEKLMVRYLLGDLSEEQQVRVEGMFLGDDLHYEWLLALEDELFYDYVQGKLSTRERAQFNERFLASGRNRKRALLASALAQIFLTCRLRFWPKATMN